MSDETYLDIALKVFDLHYTTGHRRDFRSCQEQMCMVFKRQVMDHALEQLRRGRENVDVSVTEERQPWTVKLRPGGTDWEVTEPQAPCRMGQGPPHRIVDHLDGGLYWGIPLNHGLENTES